MGELSTSKHENHEQRLQQGGSSGAPGQSNELTLRPNRPDLNSAQFVMNMAAVLVLLLTVVVYAPGMSSGFLIEDYLHIETVAAAMRADWQPFLAALSGSSHSAYQPLSLLFLLVEGVGAGLKATTFHFFNLALCFTCSYLTGLITLELTGLKGNKLVAVPAMWAGCLFAVYPLHVESFARVSGQADLLCGAFYLTSIFTYLRFRLLREGWYFKLSLVAFACALSCKEIAVTLPCVILLAELLLFGTESKELPVKVRENRVIQRVSYVLAFGFVLSFLAGLRLGITGTLSTVRAAISSFDAATLMQLLVPVANDDLLSKVLRSVARFLLPASYALSAILLVSRLVARTVDMRIILFLAGWMIVALLPALPDWSATAAPQAGRLFFNSSAPLCMLIVFMALPAIDTLKKKFALPLTAAGAIALSCIMLVWTTYTEAKLIPAQLTGRRVQEFQEQLLRLLNKLPEGRKAVILNLPPGLADSTPGSMARCLNVSAKPPFAPRDYSASLCTLPEPAGGDAQFVWPQQIRDALAGLSEKDLYVANHETNEFEPLITRANRKTELNHTFGSGNDSKLTITPTGLKMVSAKEWKNIGDNYSVVESGSDFLRIRPGRQSICVRFTDAPDIDPLECDLLSVSLKASGDIEQLKDKIWVVWNSKPSSKGGRTNDFRLPISTSDGTNWTAWLGRHRDWLVNTGIRNFSLVFDPGDYEVDLKQLSLTRSTESLPKLVCEKDSKSPTKATLRYDCSSLINADSCKLLASGPNRNFEAATAFEVSSETTAETGPLAVDKPLQNGRGEVPLPQEILAVPGTYQLRLIALDRSGKRIGLPSEPVTLEVIKAEGSQADIRIDRRAH